MSHKITDARTIKEVTISPATRFFTETVEVGRLSALSFFEAGASLYKNERFYWQNSEKTLTLVGIGHAYTLSNDKIANRFMDISEKWKQLCSALIKEEKDVDPILFGGFSFDEENRGNSEWDEYPSAYFVVPSFQMKIEDGKTLISINMITDNKEAAEDFDRLREERDYLIHLAQVEEFDFADSNAILSTNERNKEQYIDAVENVTKSIRNGKADKVVIARALELQFEHEIIDVSVLHSISNEQQESYHFGLQKGDSLFFGATPERLIQIQDGKAYSACVAGSIRRGKTAVEDRELGEELLGDRKNREEHQYVVGMISSIFENYCNEVRIPKTPKLMKIRDIQHLYTPVEGMLGQEVDIFTFVEALHPTPALGGVPTDVALTIIGKEEGMDRGYYAAPIGWTDAAGNGEFAVAIRSSLIKGDRAYLYAGGGIVADSNPEQEYDETWVKFRPVLRALGGKLNG
ncbi:isochorismate synthase [Sporosarcina highlanderae]|uniref:isochorismate synthase n=1 Tax=Sporosarcina highlanderae TaxID=3035916 RepID=A0ABT8JSL9_9BACL|nr:isochorismate synthase [Sporosarcina highlanderae]MDN4607798.1 isochorismate synthase [Sporosarcina highlanderae]